MIATDEITEYLRDLHYPSGDAVLEDMYDHAARDHIPVVFPATGAFLRTIAAATAAKRAVEVGTAIGVSTLNLARGGAHVTSFEIDEERHNAALDYMDRAGVSDKVDLRLQDATEGLRGLEGPFDLAFVDGPKTLYGGHIEMILPLLRPGGLLLIDNALLSGTVSSGPDGHWDSDQISQMQALNYRLTHDPALIGAVTPVGDGVGMAVRI